MLLRKRRAAKLVFRPALELYEDTSVEPDWVWKGAFARENLTLFAGPGKGGKSTLLFGLLGAMEQRRDYLGIATNGVGAVILSEEPGSAFKKKMLENGVVSIDTIRRNELYGTPWRDQVAAARDHALAVGYPLLIVDTITDLTELEDDDENNSGAVRAVLSPLKEAATTGLAVVALHHHRKSGGTNGAGIRGSSVFVSNADIIVELHRVSERKGDNRRTLSVFGRYEPFALALDYDAREGYAAVRSREETDFTRILVVIDQRGEASTPEIKEAMDGIASSTVEARLTKMNERGLINIVRGSGTKGDPHVWSRPL